MAHYTVQISRTQYAYIEVEAEDMNDALDKADDYYDDHFEEIDHQFEVNIEEYDRTVLA